jgi:hypothetical protein
MARDRPRDRWIERIKAVEREYIAARKAVDDFLVSMNRGTAAPPPGTKVRDVHAMSENLEGTYLIRLFAAFESGLRSYWATIRKTKPAVRHLIDTIATVRGVPDDLKDEVHEVREYRNRLVHESDDEAVPVAIDVARSRLCTYFARLPDKW